MNEFLDNLKKQASENPLAALGAGAFALTALGKVLSAGAQQRNSRAWKKEVNRRVRKTK